MWNYAGSAQAFAFLGRLGPRDRQRLLDALHRMALHPPLDLTPEVRDETGRELFAWRAEEFEILFWPDHAVRELRDRRGKFRAEVAISWKGQEMIGSKFGS